MGRDFRSSIGLPLGAGGGPRALAHLEMPVAGESMEDRNARVTRQSIMASF